MENQNETKKTTKGWGGARSGAGRKKSDNVKTLGFCAPQDVVDILNAQPNRSAYIIEAIRAYAKQNKP